MGKDFNTVSVSPPPKKKKQKLTFGVSYLSYWNIRFRVSSSLQSMYLDTNSVGVSPK